METWKMHMSPEKMPLFETSLYDTNTQYNSNNYISWIDIVHLNQSLIKIRPKIDIDIYNFDKYIHVPTFAHYSVTIIVACPIR